MYNYNNTINVRGCSLLLLLAGLLLSSTLLLSGCKKEGASPNSDEEGRAVIAFGIRSINDSNGDLEVKVNTVRAIIARPSSGEILFNQLIEWDNNGATTKAPIGGKYSKAIKWQYEKGNYDLYFVANEESLSRENQLGLIRLYNVIDFSKIKAIDFSQGEIAGISANKGLLN